MAAVTATATATATAGGTKDGRKNFVLCNGELGTIVYILCVRGRYILRERKAKIERKGKNSGVIMSYDSRIDIKTEVKY